VGPTRTTKSPAGSGADSRFRFTAYALDYAAAVRGAKDALTRDPEVIEQWGRELRRRWDGLDEARRAAIVASLRTYGEVEVAEAASEDAEAAIRFLLREE
jgi:hypothetical protein